MTQISYEIFTDSIRQREKQRCQRLALWNPDSSYAPLNIIKLQSYDLASAQAVGGDEKEHRVVASTLWRGAVDRPQQHTDRLPCQGARKTLAAVDPGRIDLCVEPRSYFTLNGEKPQEHP